MKNHKQTKPHRKLAALAVIAGTLLGGTNFINVGEKGDERSLLTVPGQVGSKSLLKLIENISPQSLPPEYVKSQKSAQR